MTYEMRKEHWWNVAVSGVFLLAIVVVCTQGAPEGGVRDLLLFAAGGHTVLLVLNLLQLGRDR